jgi:hypothetical protein
MEMFKSLILNNKVCDTEFFVFCLGLVSQMYETADVFCGFSVGLIVKVAYIEREWKLVHWLQNNLIFFITFVNGKYIILLYFHHHKLIYLVLYSQSITGTITWFLIDVIAW